MIRRIRDLFYPVCPQCNGAGGSEGYYGGDWDGCSCCNPEEDREEDVVRIWFWQVWRHRYEMWQRDRWVDRQVEADEKRWAAEEAERRADYGDCLDCRCEPHQRCAGMTVVSRPNRGEGK